MFQKFRFDPLPDKIDSLQRYEASNSVNALPFLYKANLNHLFNFQFLIKV